VKGKAGENELPWADKRLTLPLSYWERFNRTYIP
jgi:hypothetical protein